MKNNLKKMINKKNKKQIFNNVILIYFNLIYSII